MKKRTVKVTTLYFCLCASVNSQSEPLFVEAVRRFETTCDNRDIETARRSEFSRENPDFDKIVKPVKNSVPISLQVESSSSFDENLSLPTVALNTFQFC